MPTFYCVTLGNARRGEQRGKKPYRKKHTSWSLNSTKCSQKYLRKNSKLSATSYKNNLNPQKFFTATCLIATSILFLETKIFGVRVVSNFLLGISSRSGDLRQNNKLCYVAFK